MSEDNNVPNTPLDQGIDSRIKTPNVQQEIYKKNFLGATVAEQSKPLSDTAPEQAKSWTLSEIERTVATDILPNPKEKLTEFGVGLQRRNDFRLRSLNSRLTRQLQRDFIKDINTGPVEQRVRNFDIQAHSMRVISTNAVLGSFQFQKKQVLPFMRKSLALDYEKTGLLKKVVESVRGLEKSTLVKLEAIKLNTAACTPFRPTFLQRIREKGADRIATNVSNLIMTRYDDLYQKTISPYLSRLHKKIMIPGVKGGFNGAASSITTKLNNLRDVMTKEAEKDPSAMTKLEKIKQTGAKLAAGALGPVSNLTNKIKLSPKANSITSRIMSLGTSFLDNLNPFQDPLNQRPITNERGEIINARNQPLFERPREMQLSDFIKSFRTWQTDAVKYQQHLLDHVAAIRQVVVPEKVITRRVKERQAKSKASTDPISYAKQKIRDAVAAVSPAVEPKTQTTTTVAPPSIPPIPSFSVPKITTPKFIRDRIPKVSISSPVSLEPLPKTTPVQSGVSKVLKTTQGVKKNIFGKLVERISNKTKAIIPPSPPKSFGMVRSVIDKIPSRMTDTVGKAAAIFGSVRLASKKPTPTRESPWASPQINQDKKPESFSLLKSLTNDMGEHFKKVERTSAEANKATVLFRKKQLQQQKEVEKIEARAKPRANSYQDTKERREKEKAEQAAMRAARKTASISAPLPPPPPAPSSGFPSIIEMGGLALGALGKTAAKGVWGATKLGFRGVKKVLPGGGRLGEKIAKVAMGVAKREGAGTVRLGWRAAKEATRLSGKGLLGLTKLGGKGSLSLLKGGAGLLKGGLGVGLAAGIGNSFLQKSDASEGVKRIGGTALSMLSYGAVGAQIGALFGGIGAVPGALIGSGIGAVIANSDYAAKALKALGSGVYAAGSGLYTTIFGQNAIVRRDGTVVQQEKSSILGDIKIAFFGRKARYSSSGQLIASERMSLAGDVQYGFKKLFFGDQYDNGEYKQGTSIVEMTRDAVAKSLTSFGSAMYALPGEIKKGVASLIVSATKGAAWAQDKVAKGASAAAGFVSRKVQQVQEAGGAVARGTQKLYTDLSSKSLTTIANETAAGIANNGYFMAPVNFAIGASSAIFGWGDNSGLIDNPSSPYFAYGTQILDAYGIKNRALFKFIHSLEMSQDKVNSGQTKAFDDNDMAYMAGRFGFDPKNKEAVNYFKLWYKRRFIPAMGIIGKVLKAHQMTFGSVMGASDEDIRKVVDDLKKELGSVNLKAAGLEPSVQAYNKYAKIGSADPGGVNASTVTNTKPFDPRDPKNRSVAANDNRPRDPNNPFNLPTFANPNLMNTENDIPQQRAARKNATIVKGGVTMQPEFKAAFQKLPPNLRAIVSKRKALQFLLWSTAVQHGADNASMIFQRDYSSELGEKAYIRSIYQDRAKQFNNLSSEDRASAASRLGDEQRFTEQYQSGKINPTMTDARGLVNGVIDPNSVKLGTREPGPSLKQVVPYAQESQRKYGVPASVILAQYQLESAGGKRMPAGSNNPFGIKARGNQPYVLASTKEQGAGGLYSTTAKFRKFNNLQEAIDAHSQVLMNKRYANAQANKDDPVKFAHALTGIYATDRDYGNKLVRIMRSMNLTQFDSPGSSPKTTTAPAGAAPGKSSPQTPARQIAKEFFKPTPSGAKTPMMMKPTAKPVSNDNKHIKENTAALKAHTAAMMKAQTPSGPIPASTPAPASQNTNIFAPRQAAAQSGGNFVSMSMKKAAVAVGET